MAKTAKIDDVKRSPRLSPPNSRPIIVNDHSGPAVDPMIAGGDDAEKKGPTPPPTLSHTAKTITPLNASGSDGAASDMSASDAPKSPQSEAANDTSEGGSPAAVITPVAVLKKEAVTSAVPDVKADDDDAVDATDKPVVTVAQPSQKAKPAVAPSTSVAQPAQSADKAPTTASDSAQSSTDKPTNAIDELTRDPEAATKAEDNAAEQAKAKRAAELERLIASGKYEVPINMRAKKRSRLHALLFSLLALVLTVALVDAVLDEGLVEPPAGVPHTHFFSK